MKKTTRGVLLADISRHSQSGIHMARCAASCKKDLHGSVRSILFFVCVMLLSLLRGRNPSGHRQNNPHFRQEHHQ